MEPLSSSPLNRVLGDVNFGTNSVSSKCDVLVAAAMTPGGLKHGKIVDINHFHAHERNRKAAWDPVDWEVGFVFGLLKGKRRAGFHNASKLSTSTPLDHTRRQSGDLVMSSCSWTLPHRLQLPYRDREKSASGIVAV